MDSPTRKTARRRWQIPAPVTLIAIALCLVLRENFPFSHLPMYSNLSNSTSYIYVADKEGQPIPIETLTGRRTGSLKKLLRTNLTPAIELSKAEGTFSGEELMTAEQRRPAGDATLRDMLDDLEPRRRENLDPYRPLQLYQVYVHIDGHEIIYGEAELIGAESP